MGDSYADALSSGIGCITNIESLNLSSNNITDRSFPNVICKLEPECIQDMDLSDNQVGVNCMSEICGLLEDDK